MASRAIVLGLGNPGARYRDTRHNIGFMVIDQLAQMTGTCLERDPELAGRALTAETSFEGQPLVLAQPRTYMNRSGRAALALARRYEVDSSAFVVVYDDADLELGRIRVRDGGGAGGHNGIRSLIDLWGTESFARVRLGVRGVERDDQPLAEYVLSPFAACERTTVDELCTIGATASLAVARDGARTAMNEFNGRRVGETRPASERQIDDDIREEN